MNSVTTPQDPRLEPYRNIRLRKYDADSDFFIAEGKLVVDRLLESSFEIHSILISSKRVDDVRRYQSTGHQVLVVEHATCEQLVGFHFHRGILACGLRRRLTSWFPSEDNPRSLLVGCPQTALAENLGSIVRNAVAFGAEGILVGPRSIDPFGRRVNRVSMGYSFHCPMVQPDNFEDEVNRLRQQNHYQVVGLSPNAAVPLSDCSIGPKCIIMLGGEADGLAPDFDWLCDVHVRIEMINQIDSLNVATAAGIALYRISHQLNQK